MGNWIIYSASCPGVSNCSGSSLTGAWTGTDDGFFLDISTQVLAFSNNNIINAAVWQWDTNGELNWILQQACIHHSLLECDSLPFGFHKAITSFQRNIINTAPRCTAMHYGYKGVNWIGFEFCYSQTCP